MFPLNTTSVTDEDEVMIHQLTAHVQGRVGYSLNDLRIELCSSGLILRGYVTTYRGRLLAEDMSRQLSGLGVVANGIEVV